MTEIQKIRRAAVVDRAGSMAGGWPTGANEQEEKRGGDEKGGKSQAGRGEDRNYEDSRERRKGDEGDENVPRGRSPATNEKEKGAKTQGQQVEQGQRRIWRDGASGSWLGQARKG